MHTGSGCLVAIACLVVSILILHDKIFEGENFHKTVYTKNWWIIIFWQMLKIAKVPNII